MPRVVVKKGREESLLRFHPWLFSGAIQNVEGAPQPGDVVQVTATDGAVLGFGHFYDSSIAVKMLTFTKEIPAASFYKERIRSAINVRATLGLLDSHTTTAFRLVHAEGDGLPGLIIDILGDVAVAEFHSAGMLKERDQILGHVRDELGARICALITRNDEGLSKSIGASKDTEVFWGVPGFELGERIILEQGHRFVIDLMNGQKTGFFTDQRVNRRLVAAFAQGKSVLDCFTYSGGFAVYAACAGAKSVTFVDSSKGALALAQRNISENAPQIAATGIDADALHYLKGLSETFDVIIIDPPAFVKHRGALTGGCKGYETINYLAIAKVRSGGIVGTFSCSQLVTREMFRKIVFQSAQKSGRKVRVLTEVHQAPCHPVSLYHPEGEYLKGLILQVE